jgi:hypothetical protein
LTATRKTKPTPRAARAAKPRRTAEDRALAMTFLAILKTGGDVRARKVRRLRAAIRARRYENALKLAVAAERAVTDQA